MARGTMYQDCVVSSTAANRAVASKQVSNGFRSYDIQVRYEWDEAKRQGNLTKHGVDFTLADGFDWEAAWVLEDTRQGYREARFVAYAPIGTRLHALVYTLRGTTVRIISLRKANRREFNRYAAQTDSSD